MNGVSYDHSKAQQVEAFAQFLELLSDPAALAKLFKDIKEARSAAEEAIKAKTEVDKVDAYVKRAEADIDAKYTKLEAEVAESQALAETVKKMQSDFKAVSEARERELKVRADEQAAREGELTKRAEALRVAEAAAAQAKAAAEAAEEAARKAAQSFADKEEALKKALGG